MHCPSCGTLNPTQARFCMGCGRLMVNGVVCGTCHTLSPPQARFCYHCGAFLPQAAAGLPQGAAAAQVQPVEVPATSPARPPAAQVETGLPSQVAPAQVQIPGQLPAPLPLKALLPSLEHYLPRDLYEPLERRPKEQDFIAVRNHLTALLRAVKTYLPWPVVLAPQPAGEPAGGMYQGVFLFGDVSGFTPLSERLRAMGQLGAERITDIINNLFSQLVRELFGYGGTLLKFGGDALLGLFPAETDEEMQESALRATQTAMAMQRVLAQDEFATIPIGDGGGELHALKIKCGLSAGPYFAAHIGTRPRPETGLRGTMAYVTTGSTVNLAEEAESHAYPGQVSMTKAVFDLLGDWVEVGPVTRSPDENFRLLLSAPPLGESRGRPTLDEAIEGLPEGEVMAQITYLVERLDRLTLYLSTELVSRIVTNPRDTKITPEHRPVTVMFANYKGLSKLIERMGDSRPDLITRHLNDYFVHMAEIVEKYEGTLARMDQYAVGDRLVTFFGAPRAHEDDPVRAVYTALEMQEAVRKNFAALRTATGVYRFEQRIGINTGHLFAGNVGAPDLRQEYTLMGDDINMAARLMSNAGWQDIFISRKTRDQVTAFFDLEDKGQLKVKGKEIRIPTFKVLGRRGETGRTRGLGHGESPLTGRGELLALFKARGQMFLKGRGQIVLVTGKSGLGKSRLLREFKHWLVDQEEAPRLLWIEARALSFSEQMSYWMAAETMRGLLKLKADANEDDVLFALGEQGEQLLGEDAMDAIPYLAHMMGLQLGEEWAWVKSEDPKVRQKQTFWAVSELFTWAARERPIVIALDDLHWADEASLTLVEHLLAVTDRAPLLFCLVFRPHRDKRCWQLHDRAAGDYPHRYTEIGLEPLDRALSAELLTKLLPGAEFKPETLEEILDKAAGNPFYLEEVVRSLIEDNVVVPDAEREDWWQVVPERVAQIKVPDTLHAAIVARIDRLGEDARQSLQTAAVIGREFRLELLRNVVEAEAEIDAWIAQLERGGLVCPVEIAVDPTYAFPDALVQEVAYDSLLVRSRRQLHRRVGEGLENILAEKLEQSCEVLAYHFSRSDNPERALKYLEMAARKAKGEYANETAIEYYTQILEIKRSQGDRAGQAAALYSMGVMAYELGDYARARPWLQKSAALRQELDDALGEGWSVMYLGMIDLKQANYTESARCHKHAMELARSRRDDYQEGIHLTNLARVLLRTGQYERALEQFRKSMEMKQQMEDFVGEGFALFYQGLINVYLGQYDEAEVALLASIARWKRVEKNERGLAYCQQGLGLLALARDQYEGSVAHFQNALDICERLVLKAETIENLSHLSQAQLGLGEVEAAAESSGRAIRLLAAQKDVEEVQQIYLNHYRVLAALDDPLADDFLQKAYDAMMSQAGRIADEKKRQAFLEKVRVNQEISAVMRVTTQAVAGL